MARRLTDHYGTLGVEPRATQDEIKRAWRKIARETHPDIHGEDEQLTDRFKRAQKAYKVLSDPEKRQRYDLLRHVESSRQSCMTCGRPVYDGHGLCRFCRVAAEQERKQRAWRQRQAELREQARRMAAEAQAKARRREAAERDQAMQDQQRMEDEFGVFGNDTGMGLSSSDELLQSLLAESAIRRADRGHRPSVKIGRDGVTVDLRPGVTVTVDRDMVDRMRQVHRNLTTAEKLVRQIRRWF